MAAGEAEPPWCRRLLAAQSAELVPYAAPPGHTSFQLHPTLPTYAPPPQPPPQVIAEPDERYAAYCASSDFIREHIFPGGHLPCMGAMVDAARGTGLSGGWVGR